MSESEFELYLELLGKFLKLRPGQRGEIADELRDHLEARLEELSRSGLSRADAVRRALDEFGDAACLADHFSQLARDRKKRFIMRCTLGTVSLAALVLIIGTAFWPHGAAVQIGSAPSSAWAKPEATEPDDKPAAADVDPDARVNQVLDQKKTMLDFSQTPATQALEFLSEQLGVDIVVGGDLRVGLETDPFAEPITLSVRHTQLTGRAALQLVLDQVRLDPLHFTYVVRDGLVRIRWSEDDTALTVAMLDVRSLLGDDPKGERLITAVQQMVLPETWRDNGGLAGSISVFNGLLLVRHTPDGVKEVKQFVDQLAVVIKEVERAGK